MNENEEEFGENRLTDVVLRNQHQSAEDLIELILDAVQSFVGKAPEMDDKTLVIVKKE